MKCHAVILASFLSACLAAFSQISEVEVQFGGTVSLPCNSSAYGRGELDVLWEAMGKDIASFQKNQLVSGQGYEGRVELELSKALEGDFSLTLKNAAMSDTDLYECLWQGKRSLSTVMLNVLPPPFPEAHTFVREGENVTLPCYGKIPKNKPLKKIFIQWLKDDDELLLFSPGEITKYSSNWHLALPSLEEVSQGILSLTINSVVASDQGIYKCLYKANDYEAPRSGVPETYILKVLGSQEHTPLMKDVFDVTEISTISNMSNEYELTTSASEDDTTMQDINRVSSDILLQSKTTTDFAWLIADASTYSTAVDDTVEVTSEILPQPSKTTDLIGLLVDDSTNSTRNQDTVREILPQPSSTTGLFRFIADDSAERTTVQNILEVISEIQHPSRITNSIADSNRVQDSIGGEEELFEFLLDEKVPWVRIGIISGVLLVTAVFLGTVVALGKL